MDVVSEYRGRRKSKVPRGCHIKYRQRNGPVTTAGEGAAVGMAPLRIIASGIATIIGVVRRLEKNRTVGDEYSMRHSHVATDR